MSTVSFKSDEHLYVIVFTSGDKIVPLSIFLEKAIKITTKCSSLHTEARRKLRFEHNMSEHMTKLF